MSKSALIELRGFDRRSLAATVRFFWARLTQQSKHMQHKEVDCAAMGIASSGERNPCLKGPAPGGSLSGFYSKRSIALQRRRRADERRSPRRPWLLA
jgi:hypothetical protein